MTYTEIGELYQPFRCCINFALYRVSAEDIEKKELKNANKDQTIEKNIMA